MAAKELRADVLIVGGGTGGVAAALGAAALGRTVILTEPTDWIGGQFTSQAVPPDEHPWIENFGCTRRYRELREGIRRYYRDHYPLAPAARSDPRLNPGGGTVSRLCHEPRVCLAVMEQMLAPHRTTGRVRVLLEYEPIRADVDRDRVRSITLRDTRVGGEVTVSASYVLDATELGDLLPMTGTEYVSGAESQAQTGEPHAPPEARANDVQGFTWCFPVAWDPSPGADYRSNPPARYARWRDYVPRLTPPWPGRLLSRTYSHPITLEPISRALFPTEAPPGGGSLWNYRKIVRNDTYPAGHEPHEVSLVNWPMNDYWERNVIDAAAADVAAALEESKQLSLALLHWMQTEAPRPDGGQGYPGLYLRPDLVGTTDGLAKAPYFRESRRIRAVFTVTENHVGTEARRAVAGNGVDRAEAFFDSVGVGCYRIDLHPTTGGRNYLDISSLPFQIPLGALLPVGMENLLPACKNIGTTHITNGCYRLHPVEWNIGEAAGLLAAFCIDRGVTPREVRDRKELLDEFQTLLDRQGVELDWPRPGPV